MAALFQGPALLAWPIVLPMAGALLASVVPARARPAACAAAILAAITASFLLLAGVVADGPLRHHVGGWGAPLGIDLYADGLSVLMVAMTAVVGGAVSLYASGYFKPEQARHFWPLWLMLWAGLNALFLTADLFNFYVTLEVLTLSAVALVALGGGREALAASARYLFIAMLGSLAYLAGVALVYAKTGALDLDLDLLRGQVGGGPLDRAALALMLGGLAAKTALFPLHVWLPPAHGSAPAPVSAALSALVVKASFYITLRCSFTILTPDALDAIGPVLGALGAAAVLWGSLLALTQERLKLMVAYSTVAQVGYLFLLFPVAMPGSQAEVWQAKAWSGGLFHCLSHALAKAAMFMAAGAVLKAAGRDDRAALHGLSERMPVTISALAVAGVTIMALPPSGGFVAKWMMLVAAIRTGQWWWVPLMIGGGLLAAGYLFRMLRHCFMAPEAGSPALRPVPRRLEFTALALALLAMLLGLASVAPLAVARVGAPFPLRAFLEAL